MGLTPVTSPCRFHSFLLFLGQPSSSVRDIKVTTFCRIISEFSLEYRTTRERVLTRKHKRAAHRERTKTRGKMITEVRTSCSSSPLTAPSLTSSSVLPASQTEKFSGAVPQPDILSPVSLATETEPGQEAEHQNMKSFLTSGPSLSVQQGGLRRSRAVRSKTSSPMMVAMVTLVATGLQNLRGPAQVLTLVWLQVSGG